VSDDVVPKSIRSVRSMLLDLRGDVVLVLGNWLLRWPGHSFRLRVLRDLMRVDVDASCSVERGVRLLCRRGVRIGSGSNVNRGVVLDGRGGLSIGRRVNISPEAVLLTAEHEIDSPTFDGRLAPVTVGDRCWIATRAVILPGSDLGDGSVIGAGTVIRGVVEPQSVVVGTPARTIRLRAADAQSILPTYRRWLH